MPPAYDRERFTEYLDARRPRIYAEPKGAYIRNGLSFYSGEDIYKKPINNLYRENNSVYEKREGYRGKDRYCRDSPIVTPLLLLFLNNSVLLNKIRNQLYGA